MKNFDQFIEEQIQSDTLNTKPSEKVMQHLQNKILVNSASSSIKQNSFIPPFTTLFGKKHLAWKISAAAVLLISFMGIQHMNHSTEYVQYADSTQVRTPYDTLNFQMIDSSYIY